MPAVYLSDILYYTQRPFQAPGGHIGRLASFSPSPLITLSYDPSPPVETSAGYRHGCFCRWRCILPLKRLDLEWYLEGEGTTALKAAAAVGEADGRSETFAIATQWGARGASPWKIPCGRGSRAAGALFHEVVFSIRKITAAGNRILAAGDHKENPITFRKVHSRPAPPPDWKSALRRLCWLIC